MTTRIDELLTGFGFKKDEDGNFLHSTGVDSVEYHLGDCDVIRACGHLLDFCGCGSNIFGVQYVHDCLMHLYNHEDPSYMPIIISLPERTYTGSHAAPDHTAHYEMIKADRAKLFTNENAEFFFWYWADHKGFTDHGGSVPGWLTNEGHKMLELCHLALEEENNNNAEEWSK